MGLDLAKTVFQALGADGSGGMVLRNKLGRDQAPAFFSGLPPCMVETAIRTNEAGRVVVILGWHNKLAALLMRLPPDPLVRAVIQAGARRYHRE